MQNRIRARILSCFVSPPVCVAIGSHGTCLSNTLPPWQGRKERLMKEARDTAKETNAASDSL